MFYFKNLKKKGIKEIFKIGAHYILFANFFVKVINFVFITFLSKILSKEDLGILSYTQTIVQFFSPFTAAGLSYGFFIIATQQKKKIKILFWLVQKLALKFNIGLVIFGIFFSIVCPCPFKEVKFLFIILLITKIIQSHRELVISYLRVLKKNFLFATFSIENSLIIAILGLLGAYFWNLKGVVVGFLFAALLSFYLSIRFFAEKRIFKITDLKVDKKKLIKLSIISSVTNLISSILYFIDTFLVGTLLKSEEKVSEYYIAALIPFNLFFIPLSIMSALYPYISENLNNILWLKRSYIKYLRIIFLINLIIVFILLLLSKWIILCLFGPSYINSVEIFRILLLGYLFSGTFRIVSGNFLAAMGKVELNLVISLISGILNIILDYFLIIKLSTVGAAIATTFIMIFSSILSTIFVIYVWRKKKC